MVRKALAACAALWLGMLGFTSCETENIGAGPPDWSQYYTNMTLSLAVPAGMTDGANATWTLTINGGLPPYTVDWDFGGGADPNTFHITNASHPNSSVTTEMQQGTWNATVTVTDLTGLSATTNVAYTVGPSGPPPPIVPVINSATYNSATQELTVVTSTTEAGETLTVNLQVPAGFNVDASSKVAPGPDPRTAVFNITAASPAAGATGTFVVTVTDSDGDTSAPVSVVVTIAPVVPPPVIPADTLVAVPQVAAAQAAEAVTLVVSTGVTANPFQYMNGVGVTIESDAAYVPASFNVGAVGGATADPDGIWANMNPSGGFLLPPDNFIVSTAIGGGRERWDFNITPIGGSDLTGVGGDLFNCQFTFTAMGNKTFGFQDVSGVKRTYYSDGALNEYFWGDITNSVAGFRNSVQITTGTPFTMPADTIAAVPTATAAAVGAPVTVSVETGAPANPFQFMNGVGIVVDNDATYVPNSFNVGAVGGARDAADGIWANMNGGTGPTGGFLLRTTSSWRRTSVAGRSAMTSTLRPSAGRT
jgi:hypothetical protein